MEAKAAADSVDPPRRGVRPPGETGDTSSVHVGQSGEREILSSRTVSTPKEKLAEQQRNVSMTSLKPDVVACAHQRGSEYPTVVYGKMYAGRCQYRTVLGSFP